MVRSLWSAATGMNAQQTNVDTIANNLANVNSAGYKAQVAQFKSLLYQTLQTATTTANGDPKPVTSQVGLGVRTAAINQLFGQGSFLSSESDTAFAIQGDGFFAVRNANGETNYTRNGDFTWATGGANRIMLTTSDGLPVLDTNGRNITLAGNVITNKITIGSDGTLPITLPSRWELRLVSISLGMWQAWRGRGILSLALQRPVVRLSTKPPTLMCGGAKLPRGIWKAPM